MNERRTAAAPPDPAAVAGRGRVYDAEEVRLLDLSAGGAPHLEHLGPLRRGRTAWGEDGAATTSVTSRRTAACGSPR